MGLQDLAARPKSGLARLATTIKEDIGFDPEVSDPSLRRKTAQAAQPLQPFIPDEYRENTGGPRMALVNASMDDYQKSMGDSERRYMEQMAELPEPAYQIEGVDPGWAARNPSINKALAIGTAPIRKVMSSPFMERAGQSGAEIMTTVDNPNKATTGSRAGDVAADLTGALMGFTANPAGGIQSAGAGLWGIGERAAEAGLRKIPQVAKLPAFARTGLKLGAASVPFEAGMAALNERPMSAGEMGTAAGANALLGVLPGLGRLAGMRKAPSLDAPAPEVLAPTKKAKPLPWADPSNRREVAAWVRMIQAEREAEKQLTRPVLPEMRLRVPELAAPKPALPEMRLRVPEMPKAEVPKATLPEMRLKVPEMPKPKPRKQGIAIPIDERTFEAVGNRKVNAYQYDHPEVKQYIQAEAERLLQELKSAVKGEKIFGRTQDGTLNVTGTKRFASEPIERILNNTKATYAEIENALQRIIKDEGAENQALAKRIELIIDDNLTGGVKTFEGIDIPPNADYVAIKNRIQGKGAVKPAESTALTDEELFDMIEGNIFQPSGDLTREGSISLTNERANAEAIRLAQELANTPPANRLPIRGPGIGTAEAVDPMTGYMHGDNKGILLRPEATPAPEPARATIPRNIPKIRKRQQPSGDLTREGSISAAKPELPNSQPLPKGVGAASLKPPSTIETITSKTEVPPIWKRITPASVQDVIKKAYYKTIDGYNRLNDIEKLAAKAGRHLSASERPYILAHNASATSEVIAREVLNTALIDSQGNVIGKPLMEITRKVPKNKWRELEDYMKLRHFKSWEAQGMEVYPKELNMNEILANRKVAEYDAKYPWMRQVADEYTAWINQFSEAWLVDTGLVSREAWSAMRQKYGDYVPLQRLMQDIEIGIAGGAGKRSFVDQSGQIKRAKGSERQTVESLETMLERIPQYIKAAKRNEVAQRTVDLLKAEPEALKAFGEIVDPKTTNINLKNIVTVNVDGQKVYFRVNDEALLDSLMNLAPPAQNVVINTARKATGLMKVLTTGINPVFSLGRNIIRDIPMSFVASKSTNNPAVWAKDLVGALIDVVGNREAYRAFKAMGGGHVSPIASERNLLAEAKAGLFKKGIKPGDLNPIKWLEKLADITETIPRMGEFRRILRQEGNTYAAKQKALFESRDLTINFWKKNSAEITNFLDAFVPYFSAAINGVDKFARIYKDNPMQGVAKSVMAVTVPTVWLYAINRDNPDYQKLSSWVKDNNYCIPLPNGTFLKLPKPWEVGNIFGAPVERLLRLFQEHDPKAFDGFMESFMASFVPPNPLTENIASPVINLATNPDPRDFLGRPVVPGYMKNLSPGLQYDEKTSSFAKKLGEMFPKKVSPKKVDYLARSYLGILGQAGIPALSEGDTMDAIQRMFTADPAYSQDKVNNFYEAKDKVDTMYYDEKSKGGALEGDNEKLRKLYDKIADVISETNKQRRELEKDKTLDNETKKAQLRGLQLAIVSLAEIAEKPLEEQLRMYDELKKKGRITEAKQASDTKKAASKKKEQEKYDEIKGILLPLK